ncbi:MAG TPA: TIGR03118 family protein [Chthoniobacterales bacterium]|nr:TIGR03118 family protein [Chthoniobacterales bacterium]
MSQTRVPTKRSWQRTIALVAAASALAALVWIAPACLAAGVYLQTNLVSDLPGMAAHTDSHLVNPWGIASSANSPFWVADNHTGVSTLHDSSGTPQSLVVTVPPALAGTVGSPDGIVFNGSSDFEVSPGSPAHFIFATEDGTISGWASGTTAVIKVGSASGAVYKGLAIGNNGTANFLYATNFHANAVNVFDHNYAPVTLSAGNFSDPTIPMGYAPFNIQNINNGSTVAGVLYVTYALQDATGHDDVPGPRHGFINKFDLNGNLLGRFASQGTLNSPWGMALAPAGFGEFGGDLLVGNFGDGRINAFDPATGAFLGQLNDGSGNPITIKGLWGLRFGNGGSGGDPNTLYFAAGIPGPAGMVEDHGLFGSISVVPAERQLVNISTRASIGTGDNVAIAGFIIHTDPPALTGTKRVLLRGLGPSLKVNGVPVPGRLADPFLELHDINGMLIESNDNWMNSPERAAIMASGLAPTDLHESAILRTLIAGTNYTAILRGVNNTTGIGLVEVYDLEPTIDTHLANISGRAFVSTGDDVLIGGVIVRGDAPEEVLFRAIGPSLTAKGVKNALQDPTLDLYDVQGTLIAHNDDWMTSPQKSAIIASGLAPTDPRESAIIDTPAAGNYTAIVRGENNTTGVGLVEAYRLGP